MACNSPGLSHAVSAELVVAKLQQQLREKDLKLTDIQLEALTSAHQLDHLRDAMNRMQVRLSRYILFAVTVGGLEVAVCQMWGGGKKLAFLIP